MGKYFLLGKQGTEHGYYLGQDLEAFLEGCRMSKWGQVDIEYEGKRRIYNLCDDGDKYVELKKE